MTVVKIILMNTHRDGRLGFPNQKKSSPRWALTAMVAESQKLYKLTAMGAHRGEEPLYPARGLQKIGPILSNKWQQHGKLTLTRAARVLGRLE